ncbi:MAG: C40 family peptidase [Chitinophagaceae bacterium]|nr:C40 family peptidase [Chitinophagaceae bacterium]
MRSLESICLLALLSILFSECNIVENNDGIVKSATRIDSVIKMPDSIKQDNTLLKDTVALPPSQTINTGTVHPDEVVQFAKTLVGVPYKYASTNPSVGFDCSGFVTYVFNHFNIQVPRSSIDFTNVGKPIPEKAAKPGDLILFTGTDSTERFVGHMGLIISNTDSLRFIHSSSGKANGVTITPLNKYYRSRFVKVIRIFPQNDT